MLQSLSEQIRLCYLKAEECARRAEIVRDDALRADYRRYERRWLKLARSCELEERITLFIDRNSRREDDGDRNVRGAIVGMAAGMDRVEPPATGNGGNDPKPLLNGLIAIIDDDECARSGFGTLIESLGYRAVTFASAEEYLALDTNKSAACLILDVHLPGMSGPDLQAHLIRDARCPPIVFATGRFEEQVRRRVTKAGALGYLIKPCNEKALLNCIGQAVAERREGS